MSVVRVSATGVTHQGKVREENQDQFLLTELASSTKVLSNSIGLLDESRLISPPTSYLFVVADGMGGHRGGREASTRAIQYFLTSILNSQSLRHRSRTESEPAFTEMLRNTLVGAHRELVNYAASEPELKGMGTTFTAAYVAWPRMFVVHAGDTRCYLLRGSELILLTRDHTVAHEMIRTGHMKASAQERSPWSNVLVNALGAGADEVFADITSIDLRFGDRLLMCSDGLNKHATDEQIFQMMKSASSLDTCSSKLLEFALSEGGTDNITVVVADFANDVDTGGKNHRFGVIGQAPSKEHKVFEFSIPISEIDTNDDENGLDDRKTSTFEPDRPREEEKPTGDYTAGPIPR